MKGYDDMLPLKNPPWWDEATIQEADRGERIIQTMDFRCTYWSSLCNIDTKMCQALRRYDADKREEDLREAYSLLQAYKDFCFAHGTPGQWYYEDQVAIAIKNPEAPPYSFNGAVQRLLEKI